MSGVETYRIGKDSTVNVIGVLARLPLDDLNVGKNAAKAKLLTGRRSCEFQNELARS
jgi:hypothetical protein